MRYHITLTEGRTVRPSTTPGTLTLWHGGNLDAPPPSMGRSGRIEFGPGLYLTTHYDTARKYAKGSRALYQVVIRKGTDIDTVRVSAGEASALVRRVAPRKLQQDILSRLERFASDVPVSVVVNNLINSDALRPAHHETVRQWLVEQGADYAIEDHAFGWHERMVVVFNPEVIVSKMRIRPDDDIEPFDLPTEFV